MKLKAGDELPETDHVIRYISPRFIENGLIHGNGFLKRPTETASSVNWLEQEGLKDIRNNPNLKMSKNGLLAEINIGFTKKAIDNLAFIFDPTPNNKSHTEIHGIPTIDTPQGALLNQKLRLCIQKTYPAII